MGTFLVLNSRGASVYHIGYPVYVRIAAGMYGSMWFIFIRGIVAIFFFGTQSYYAGKMVEVMLRCVFAEKWTNLPNHLPASAGITTTGLSAFFMFWFVQFVFMFIHPSKSRWLYTVKSVLAPPILLATFGYIVGKTGGLGETSRLGTVATSSSVVGWAFMKGALTMGVVSR
jgi:NCS1 family nucleobase:cation symporter-1